MWLDREKLMLYDKEDSQHGIGFDVAGEGDGIYIFSQHLTKDEKRQLTDYMKFGRQSWVGKKLLHITLDGLPFVAGKIYSKAKQNY